MQGLLNSRSRTVEYLFGQRSATAIQAWMRRWCEREDIEPPFTLHDLCRAFSARVNDRRVKGRSQRWEHVSENHKAQVFLVT
jgi:hypothetical protein